MKTIYSALLFSTFLLVAACQDATTSSAQSKSGINKELPVDDYAQKLAASPNAQLVDVRTPGEYAEGHLKNSVNIDYNSAAFADDIAKLDKRKPVFVYCLSGGRSGMAASQMHDMGFTEVYNMKGGIMKWDKAEMPTVTGNESSNKKGMSLLEFNKMIVGEQYVLVDYNAKWCEPCKKMLPILEALAESKKDKLVLLKIDADKNKALMQEKIISSIPYLELYHNGNLVWKHDGYIDEQSLLKETKL